MISDWLTIPTIVIFLLILFRISGLLVSSPFLNNEHIPPQVKVGISLILSLILFPLHLEAKSFEMPHDLIRLSVMGTQELIIGLLIGFAANLVLTGVQMAGDLVST